MNEIKIYKELTMIILKDGDIINTTMTPEEVANYLNNNQFVVFGGVGFNKFEVKTFKQYNPKDIDCFILSLPEEQKKLVQKEVIQRESEGKKNNIDVVNNIMDRLGFLNSK